MGKNETFMEQTINLAIEGVASGKGGPFGAIVVKDGEIIGRGCNSVISNNDPTAHAEIVAIREACKNLESFQLTGCTLYTSCEPCPMCLGAIYWSRLDVVYYSASRHIASYHGFDDSSIYNEVNLPFNQRKIAFVQVSAEKGVIPFREWDKKEDRVNY